MNNTSKIHLQLWCDEMEPWEYDILDAKGVHYFLEQ
jgi:hypothetical protein